jgi:hypothetical protein
MTVHDEIKSKNNYSKASKKTAHTQKRRPFDLRKPSHSQPQASEVKCAKTNACGKSRYEDYNFTHFIFYLYRDYSRSQAEAV